MDKLPYELLVHIFKYLNTDGNNNLIILERVCRQWSYVVTTSFWSKKLIQWAEEDFPLRNKYRASGWISSQCRNDPNLIKELYFKTLDVYPDSQNIELQMDASPVKRTRRPRIEVDSSLKRYSAMDFHAHKVSSIAVHQDKLFLSLKNSTIESRNLNDLSLRCVLKSLDENEENELFGPGDHVLRNCPLSVCGVILAAVGSHEQKLYIWNAESEELIYECGIQNIGFPYDIKVNEKTVVVLSGWSLLVWKVDTVNGRVKTTKNPEIIPDFRPTEEFQNWLSSHTIEINKDFIVTHASRSRTVDGEDQRRFVSFIHIRRSGPDGFVGPLLRDPEGQDSTKFDEIDRIRLSSGSVTNLLAVLHVEGSYSADDTKLFYSIQILDVITGNQLFCLPSSDSLLSVVHIPIQWLGDRLFFKMVPGSNPRYNLLNENDDENDKNVEEEEEEYSSKLMVWNARTKSINMVYSIGRTACSVDILHISPSQIIRIHHQFPETHYPEVIEESAPIFEVRGTIYDFWPAKNE